MHTEIQSPCLDSGTCVHADAMFDGFTRDVPLSLESTREPLPELLLASPSPRLSLSEMFPVVGVGISLLRFSRQLDIFVLSVFPLPVLISHMRIAYSYGPQSAFVDPIAFCHAYTVNRAQIRSTL